MFGQSRLGSQTCQPSRGPDGDRQLWHREEETSSDEKSDLKSPKTSVIVPLGEPLDTPLEPTGPEEVRNAGTPLSPPRNHTATGTMDPGTKSSSTPESVETWNIHKHDTILY